MKSVGEGRRFEESINVIYIHLDSVAVSQSNVFGRASILKAFKLCIEYPYIMRVKRTSPQKHVAAACSRLK